jgi:hypothetical protein
LGRAPGTGLDAVHQIVDGLADGEIQHLAVQGGVVAGGAAEADDLAVGEFVLPAPWEEKTLPRW